MGLATYLCSTRLFASGAMAFVFAAAFCPAHAQTFLADTYWFSDEASGLVIALPATWERRDPQSPDRVLHATSERYLRRIASEETKKEGLILRALAAPYFGEETSRPSITCRTIEPKLTKNPSEVRALLENTGEAIKRAYRLDAASSEVERFDVSGKEAYRLLWSRNDAPSGFLFFAMLNGEWLIHCGANFSTQLKSVVENMFNSLSVR